MKISLIGSGNVAAVLGRLFLKNGHIIREIWSRNKVHAASLAVELNALACDELPALDKQSDIYIIAVSDEALPKIASGLCVDEKMIVHTSGSVPIDTLLHSSKNYGVLYPLQSLRKETSYTPPIPFLIDGNTSEVISLLKSLAGSISAQVTQAGDATRLAYHISAVVVSNFTNHLYALTKEYCAKNKIEFDLLLPLIEEIVNRLHNYEPAIMQTGPAIRGDETTLRKHLAMLKDFPQLEYVYEVMSKSIRDFKP